MDEVVKDRKKQIRRYAIAFISLLVLMPVVGGVVFMLSIIATSMAIGGWDLFVSGWNDPEVAGQHDEVFYISLSLAVLAMLGFWRTWDRFFLRSGYLNAEMVALLDRGHMPGRAETWRKRVGYVLYSFIPGLLSLKLYFEGEFIFSLIPLAVTVYIVVRAWRSSVWRKPRRSKVASNG